MTSSNPETTDATEDVGYLIALAAENAVPPAPSLKDLRLAARKKIVNGRVSVSVPRGVSTQGKLMDISLRGIGVMLESPINVNTVHSLECELLFNGTRIALSARAVAVHCILASGKGFRVGLQFESLDAATEDIIKKLLT